MKRSSAAALLANRADDDEVRDAIDDVLRNNLGVALNGALNESMPAPEEAIIIEAGRFVGLVGQNWTQPGRAEFIDLVQAELQDLPGQMVLDALARARRRVKDGRELIVWVCDDVEPKAARLKAEIEALERLTELALG